MLAHLLSARGELALADALQRRPLLAFDFDGTLAPIVARPGDARVSVAVARRLEQLSRRLPVALHYRCARDPQRAQALLDVNDEPVFERALPQWLTVRVGRDDPRSRAAYFLDSPAEVGIVLHRMLETLGVEP